MSCANILHAVDQLIDPLAREIQLLAVDQVRPESALYYWTTNSGPAGDPPSPLTISC